MNATYNFGPLEKQTKQVLFNLYKYFQAEEAKDKTCITNAAQLVAKSTGVSLGTVYKIIAESKRSPNQDHIEFSAPKKKRPRACPTALDNRGKDAIKTIIHKFQQTHHEYPTLKFIHKKLKEEIDYEPSISTLRKQIINLGFDLSNTMPEGILEVTVDS